MPLSEDEQRILREIEEQLHRDPNFAARPVSRPGRLPSFPAHRDHRWCPRRGRVRPAARHQPLPGLRRVPRRHRRGDGGRTAPAGARRRGHAAGGHDAAQRRQRPPRQRSLTSPRHLASRHATSLHLAPRHLVHVDARSIDPSERDRLLRPRGLRPAARPHREPVAVTGRPPTAGAPAVGRAATTLAGTTA